MLGTLFQSCTSGRRGNLHTCTSGCCPAKQRSGLRHSPRQRCTAKCTCCCLHYSQLLEMLGTLFQSCTSGRRGNLHTCTSGCCPAKQRSGLRHSPRQRCTAKCTCCCLHYSQLKPSEYTGHLNPLPSAESLSERHLLRRLHGGSEQR